MKKYTRLFEAKNLILSDNEKVANYFEKVFPNLKSNQYKKTSNIKNIGYFNKYKDGYFIDISFYDHVDPPFIILKGEVKFETDSVSLADPRAAYQTTSARKVKFKKIKLEKDGDDLQELFKAIDKYKKKLDKADQTF